MRIARTAAALTAALLLTLTAAPAADAEADTVPQPGAAAAGCRGSSCTGKDPVAQGCDDDGRLVESKPYGSDASIKIQLFYSAACRANWARSVDAPDGGAVLVANRNGQKQVKNTNGAKTYVWTAMVDGSVAAHACLGPQNSDALTCTAYH